MLKKMIVTFWKWLTKTKNVSIRMPGEITDSFMYTSSRRMKRVSIRPEILMNMFIQGSMIGVEKGIMPGSRFCGFQMDPRKNVIFVFVEHPMYPSSPPGGEILEHDLIEIKDLRERLTKEMEEENAPR